MGGAICDMKRWGCPFRRLCYSGQGKQSFLGVWIAQETSALQAGNIWEAPCGHLIVHLPSPSPAIVAILLVLPLGRCLAVCIAPCPVCSSISILLILHPSISPPPPPIHNTEGCAEHPGEETRLVQGALE